MERVGRPLGEILLEAKIITENQLKVALAKQKELGGSVGMHLVKLGYISEETLVSYLGEQYGLASINLAHYDIDPSVLMIIPAGVVQKYRVIPLDKIGNTLTLAMSDPSNLFAIDDIKFMTGLNVEVVIATESAIKAAMEKYYGSAASTQALEDVLKKMDGSEGNLEIIGEEEEVDLKELKKEVEEAPVVKLVNSIITDAVQKRASDIHIEPYEKLFRVRYRIDGSLYEVMTPPPRLRAAITSRVKIMANLDIAERRLPQDGRIMMKIKDKTVDLRVSTVPTVFGEKIVMRILDKSSLNLDLTKLGFEPEALAIFEKGIMAPYGMVLVTGPTGSGKTTTLYSALHRINSIDTNIMTAEDPVEYQLKGINQVQIKEEIGLTFAHCLRSFLRQDPDIIMVGEIRDRETAEIAVKAALTGHLVLSTLHTNDAPGAITRLLDMGVEPFLVSSSVLVLLAQRLLRKICPECKKPIELPPEIIESLGIPEEEAKGLTFYKGEGCSNCLHTGYRGRIAIYEVMQMTEEIRKLVLEKAPTDVIKAKAKEQGMKTLRDSALTKLKAGITTADEVLSVTFGE